MKKEDFLKEVRKEYNALWQSMSDLHDEVHVKNEKPNCENARSIAKSMNEHFSALAAFNKVDADLVITGTRPAESFAAIEADVDDSNKSFEKRCFCPPCGQIPKTKADPLEQLAGLFQHVLTAPGERVDAVELVHASRYDDDYDYD